MKKWLLIVLSTVLLTGCQAAKERDVLKANLVEKEQMIAQYGGIIQEREQRILTLEEELKVLSAQLPETWSEDAIQVANDLNSLMDLYSDNLEGVKSPSYYGKLLGFLKADPVAFIQDCKNRGGAAIQELVHQTIAHGETILSDQELLVIYDSVLNYETESLKDEYVQSLLRAELIGALSNKGVTKEELIREPGAVAFGGLYYIHKLTLDLDQKEIESLLGQPTTTKEDALTQTALWMYAVKKDAAYETDGSLDGADMIGLRNNQLSCQIFIWFRSGVIDELQVYYMEADQLKTHRLTRTE